MNIPALIAGVIIVSSSLSKFNTAPAHPSYLIKQNFEGTGYDNGETWTEDVANGGTIDPDYTGVILEGSESLRQTVSTTGCETYSVFAAQDEVWFYMLYHPVTIDSVVKSIASIKNNSSFRVLVKISDTSKLVIENSVTVATVDSLSAGTTYHIWVHYKKGSGANGIMDAGFSTDGIRPTSGDKFVQYTTETFTSQVNRIVLNRGNDIKTCDQVYDKVRVDDRQIGDNPE